MGANGTASHNENSKVDMIKIVNNTLIFVNYLRSIRKKFKFDSVIFELSSSSNSSSYRVSRVRVFQYPAQAGSRAYRVFQYPARAGSRAYRAFIF